MPEFHLHIISFDIPYPPNYGGVIDVFHKIRSFYNAGVKIHLHCFEYHRQPAPELEKYCTEVHYYKRKTGLISALNWRPYIVFSRRSEDLLANLKKDSYPILFEGLHSCFYLDRKELKNRFKIYRESNIEHLYYYHLFKAENNPLRKLYFIFSSLKLLIFQRILGCSDLMLTVSKEDNEYLCKKFKTVPVKYLPSFHGNDEMSSMPGNGNYCLYQGNLSVPENVKAAEYLIEKVFKGTEHKLIVAGLRPDNDLARLCDRHTNVTLVPDPAEDQMKRLIREAQINIMVTFQPTGLKLKLLNALFNGRFCLVNQEMVTGTELADICEIGNSPEELRDKVDSLMKVPFDDDEIHHRKEILQQWHSNEENCKTLLNLVSL